MASPYRAGTTSYDTPMCPAREAPAGRALSRRRALRVATLAAGTALAGCAVGPFGSGPDPAGGLFVENRTESPKRIQLSVTEGGPDGDRVVHHAYRIPGEHALQFRDVLEPGRTYDVRAYQPGAPPPANEHLVLRVETCAAADPAGEMDVVVLAGANGPDILTFGCDSPYAGTDYLTYVDPSEHVTGTLTGTVPTPTSTPS